MRAFADLLDRLSLTASRNAKLVLMRDYFRDTLDPERGWPTQLKVTGDSIRAVQLPEAQIFVTPDVDVRMQLPDVRVTGTVHVPRAEAQIQGDSAYCSLEHQRLGQP